MPAPGCQRLVHCRSLGPASDEPSQQRPAGAPGVPGGVPASLGMQFQG